MDLILTTSNWLHLNSLIWKNNGFEITPTYFTAHLISKCIFIEIHKGNIMSSIQICENGACDFQQIYKDKPIHAENKYFKNIILTTESQLKWELDNFFCNYDTLYKEVPLTPFIILISITNDIKLNLD